MVNKEKYEFLGDDGGWFVQPKRSKSQDCKSPHEEIFEQSLKLGFKESNNEVEYEALINCLKMSLAIKILRTRILIDS